MTLEQRIKTGVASSLTLAVLASGITYAETSSDYFNTENYSPSSYSVGIEVNTFTSGQTGGSNVNMFTDIYIEDNLHEEVMLDIKMPPLNTIRKKIKVVKKTAATPRINIPELI
jgi:hypothetical protein